MLYIVFKQHSENFGGKNVRLVASYCRHFGKSVLQCICIHKWSLVNSFLNLVSCLFFLQKKKISKEVGFKRQLQELKQSLDALGVLEEEIFD